MNNAAMSSALEVSESLLSTFVFWGFFAGGI